MKNNIIKSLALLLLIFTASCTEESDTVQMNDSASEDLTGKSGNGSVWESVIGAVQDGEYVIVADREVLKLELENILKREDNATEITSLEIVEKAATNDPADIGYMLIGSGDGEISIGVPLSMDASSPMTPILIVDPGLFKSVTCRGCAQGCNLEYLIDRGKKYPYCNENGCYYNCKKTESSF